MLHTGIAAVADLRRRLEAPQVAVAQRAVAARPGAVVVARFAPRLAKVLPKVVVSPPGLPLHYRLAFAKHCRVVRLADRMARDLVEKAAVMAAEQPHPLGCLAWRCPERKLCRVHRVHILHVHCEPLRRDAVRLARPAGFGVVVDRPQRAVVDRHVGGRGPRRHLGGGHHSLKGAGVRRGLRQPAGDCIAVARGEVHHQLVQRVAPVAVKVHHSKIDKVAGSNLACVALDGLAAILLLRLVCLASQLLGESLFFFILNFAAGRLEGRIRGDPDHIELRQFRVEFPLERLRVIDVDRVSPGDLQHPVAHCRLIENRGDFGGKEAFSCPAAGEKHPLVVAARGRGDVDRNPCVASADAEVAVLHHDEQRVAGHVPPLGSLPQSADGAEHVQLVEKPLLDPEHLCQMVQRLVGKVVVRHSLEHGLEHLPCDVVVALPDCHDAHQELGAQIGAGRLVVTQFGEDLLRLVEHLLLDVTLRDPEAGIGRRGRLRMLV